MFDRFKPIVRDGERYVVIEGGEPRFVVMSFGDYSRLMAGASAHVAPNPRPAQPSAWPEANAELSVEAPAEPIDPATVRLEDLPL